MSIKTESKSIQKRDSNQQLLGFDLNQATQHYESKNNNEVFRNTFIFHKPDARASRTS